MATDTPIRFVRDPDVIAQPSGDSLVLFQMQSGGYFSLNGCGSRIWELCDGTRSEAHIVALLTEEYDAASEVQNDVSALLTELTARGLLKTVDPE